jgi:hypothetical protein
MRFANKTRPHGNDFSNFSTATNQNTVIEVLLETMFSTMALAEKFCTEVCEEKQQLEGSRRSERT